MRFEAPSRLVTLAIPAALLVWYVVSRHRRKGYVIRFTSLDLAETVLPAGAGWRRHVVTATAVIGMVALTLAFARPVIALPQPVDRAAVVLAIDVSLSMGADDVPPDRITAATEAARRFIELAPDTLRLGLVAFGGNALPVVAPTDEHALVAEATRRLGLGEGTAIGEAIYAALDEVESATGPDGAPAAIVVLSDGETTMGRPESEAAAEAAARGIPVHTIAFGTRSGAVSVAGQVIPVPVREGNLAEVAEVTGGEFLLTADQDDITRVLSRVGSDIAYETRETDVTEWFTIGGMVVIAAAAAVSVRWFGRVL